MRSFIFFPGSPSPAKIVGGLNAHSPLLRPSAYNFFRPNSASRKNPGFGTQDRNRGGGYGDLHFGRDFFL